VPLVEPCCPAQSVCHITTQLNIRALKSYKFGNLTTYLPTYDSVCKDNSWNHGKCRQRFLSNVYKRFFYFLHVVYVFNIFLFSYQRSLHLCGPSLRQCGAVVDRRWSAGGSTFGSVDHISGLDDPSQALM